MVPSRRVVITGLGVATPIGIGIQAFWEGLLEKRCGVCRTEAFDPSGMPCQISGALPPFKLGDVIPKSYRKSVKVMSRDIMVAVICAYYAARDAGLNTKCIVDRQEAVGPPNVESSRFGANIGAGLVCADLTELAGALSTATDENGRFDAKRWGREGMGNLTPLWLLKFLPNMLACHVTIVHDAQAPSNTITCGEASSHLAIGEAFRTILRGDADVCICGGAESKMSPMASIRPYLQGQITTAHNETPQRACQPFGANRTGHVPAEGGGLVIVESLEHARARGARIYAELVGFGAGSNTKSWSKADPTGSGMILALQKALNDAGSSADKIDLIGPFAAATVEHDAAEMKAWDEVFGSRLEKVHALTSRGAIGNNGAGSGAIDFAAMTMALSRNTIPPSINTDELDPACRLRFVQNDPIDADVAEAISMGVAVSGGQSAALVLRRFEE